MSDTWDGCLGFDSDSESSSQACVLSEIRWIANSPLHIYRESNNGLLCRVGLCDPVLHLYSMCLRLRCRRWNTMNRSLPSDTLDQILGVTHRDWQHRCVDGAPRKRLQECGSWAKWALLQSQHPVDPVWFCSGIKMYSRELVAISEVLGLTWSSLLPRSPSLWKKARSTPPQASSVSIVDESASTQMVCSLWYGLLQALKQHIEKRTGQQFSDNKTTQKSFEDRFSELSGMLRSDSWEDLLSNKDLCKYLCPQCSECNLWCVTTRALSRHIADAHGDLWQIGDEWCVNTKKSNIIRILNPCQFCEQSLRPKTPPTKQDRCIVCIQLGFLLEKDSAEQIMEMFGPTLPHRKKEGEEPKEATQCISLKGQNSTPILLSRSKSLNRPRIHGQSHHSTRKVGFTSRRPAESPSAGYLLYVATKAKILGVKDEMSSHSSDSFCKVPVEDRS